MRVLPISELKKSCPRMRSYKLVAVFLFLATLTIAVEGKEGHQRIFRKGGAEGEEDAAHHHVQVGFSLAEITR